MELQKIFKRQIVSRMIADLKSGLSLPSYFEASFAVKDDDLLPSTLKLIGEIPDLIIPATDIPSADFDNALKLHAYYKNLDETQASDPRLWDYLSHVQFRKYTIARWGLQGSYADLSDDIKRKKAIGQIVDHWFVSGNDRDLRRHSIARLWWAAHLTCAPWEAERDFFSDLKNEDPYYLTRVLFWTQDIYQQVLERGMGRSNRILISILDYLGRNEDFARTREKVRALIKELNLIYGTRKIISLEREELKKLIENIAVEINLKNEV